MALVAHALTTLSMAKTQLDIQQTNTSQDTRLELYINSATQRLESITSRKLKARALTELYHGRRQNIILLREWPVTAISSLRIDEEHVFTDPDTLIDAADYGIGDDANSLILYSGSFPVGYNNIKVAYTAGYNSTDHPGQLAELELACLWMVEWFYRHRERADMGRTSKAKGDESVGILAEMPSMIRQIVESYRRIEAPLSALPTENS